MLRGLNGEPDLQRLDQSTVVVVMKRKLLTNLVDDCHQSLAIGFPLPDLVFHPFTSRALWISRIQYLNHYITPVDDLFQFTGESTNGRISDGKCGV